GVLVGCGQSVTPQSGIGGGQRSATRAAVPTPAPPCTVAVPDGSVTITVSNTPALYADVAEPATTLPGNEEPRVRRCVRSRHRRAVRGPLPRWVNACRGGQSDLR